MPLVRVGGAFVAMKNSIISINPLGGGLLPLDSAALKLLRAQGLNTETLQLLIQDSLESKQKPTYHESNDKYRK